MLRLSYRCRERIDDTFDVDVLDDDVVVGVCCCTQSREETFKLSFASPCWARESTQELHEETAADAYPELGKRYGVQKREHGLSKLSVNSDTLKDSSFGRGLNSRHKVNEPLGC